MWSQLIVYFHLISSYTRVRVKKPLKSPVLVGLTQQYIVLNTTRTGGGSNRPTGAKLRMLRQENEKKSEKEGRKKPSPSPTTPPIPRDFIVYTARTRATLVESTNRVFSSHLFIHACKSEKTSKKPSPGRVNSAIYST